MSSRIPKRPTPSAQAQTAAPGLRLGFRIPAAWKQLAGDILPRYISHLALLGFTWLVLSLGSHYTIDLRSLEATENEEQSPPPFLSGTDTIQEVNYLLKGVIPLTIIPPRPRREVITYHAESGDNVISIAAQFGLKPETVMWSNPELSKNPDLLFTGQLVYILPVDGVYHLIEKGDTLQSIADDYKANVDDIITSEYNNLSEPYTLTAGEWLVVPGGSKPYIPRVVQDQYASPPAGAEEGTGSFMWPITGFISQGFWSGHLGIDIAAPEGTPIYASDSGYVVAAGWSGGYGNRVIIDHGNGFKTLYGHMVIILVQPGMSVERGDLLGRVGETGRATGPHIHFELWLNGVKRNPFGYLP